MMEPNEIMMSLRGAAARWEAMHPIIGVGQLRVHDAMNAAADCIERLQAENENLAISGGKYMEISQKRYEMFEAAVKRAEDAEYKLSESQRRERAAVEEIHELDRFSGKCLRCKSWNGARCKRGYSVNASFCNDWQWHRSPAQEGDR